MKIALIGYEKMGKEIEKIALENGFACRRIDQSKRTSNIIFVLSKKAHDKV